MYIYKVILVTEQVLLLIYSIKPILHCVNSHNSMYYEQIYFLIWYALTSFTVVFIVKTIST